MFSTSSYARFIQKKDTEEKSSTVCRRVESVARKALFDFKGKGCEASRILKSIKKTRFNEYQDAKRARQLISNFEHYQHKREELESSIGGGRCQGDIRLEKRHWILDNIGEGEKQIKRNNQQIGYHKAFEQALLPWYFGLDEWPANAERVMKQQGITEIVAYVNCILARRGGKTCPRTYPLINMISRMFRNLLSLTCGLCLFLLRGCVHGEWG